MGLPSANRHARIWACVLVAICVVCAGASLMIHRHFPYMSGSAVSIASELLIEPRWDMLGEVALPRHGTIRVRHRWWKTRLQHEYALQWETTAGDTRNYFIWSGGNRIAPSAEIRASRGYERVWLVTRNGGDLDSKTGRYDLTCPHVITSLDMRTGVCIGENGAVMEPSIPLDKQESVGMEHGQPGQPHWADPNGGVLLRSLAL